MSFSYKAHLSELIGKEVNASYMYGRDYISCRGRIVKFLSGNKVRLAYSDTEFSNRVFREEWRNTKFEPSIGDTVYGRCSKSDPDCINDRGNHSSQLYWKGVVEEIHEGYVIVKMSVTGRLSKRTSIRPRL